MSRFLQALAGAMGAAGVGLAAFGAHHSGSPNIGIAAQFLLVHAVAVLGCTSAGRQAAERRIWLTAAGMLAFGAVVFALDLTLIGIFDLRPVPIAAPLGGGGMFLGWLLVFTAAVAGGTRHE